MNAHWSIRTSRKSLLFSYLSYCTASNSGALNGHLLCWRAAQGGPVFALNHQNLNDSLKPHFMLWPLQLLEKEQLTHNLFANLKTRIVTFVSFHILLRGNEHSDFFLPYAKQSCSQTLHSMSITYSHVHMLREQNDAWCGNPANMISCLIYFQQPPSHTHTHICRPPQGTKC